MRETAKRNAVNPMEMRGWICKDIHMCVGKHEVYDGENGRECGNYVESCGKMRAAQSPPPRICRWDIVDKPVG